MKLKIFVYTVSLILLLVLQSTLLGYVEIYNVKPNLLVIYIVCVALLRGNIEGAAVGFFAGLMQDMAFGKLLGFYCLLGFYLGLTVGSVNRRLYRENYLVVVFFTFVATILYEAAVHILSNIMTSGLDILMPLTFKILPEAAYNSVVSILIFTLVIKVNRKFEEANKAARKY